MRCSSYRASSALNAQDGPSVSAQDAAASNTHAAASNTHAAASNAQDAAASNAPDGAAIYAERCAQCHDMPTERIPSLATIKSMSGQAIYLALTSGTMRTQAEGLGTAQIFALLGYIAPTGGTAGATQTFAHTCEGNDAFAPRADAPAWNGWSPSPTNSRFQDAAAAGLTASDVPRLALKWAFNLGDVTLARSQPTVVGGRVFLGAATGAVYALDADTGCTHWGFKAAAALRGGATFGDAGDRPAVFFGDSGANVYALDAATGELISGSVDGHLRAYSTRTGEVLWDVDTAREYETVNGEPARGGALDAAGPAIVGGMVFVNSGYGQWGGMAGNVFLAFSVDGK